jgi:hypothetical protein
MRSLRWLPLIALLVFGCKDSPDKVTAPDPVDLDRIAESIVAQAGSTPRCVQLRYYTTSLRKVQRGSDCTCATGRPASVTAMIWGGGEWGALNRVTGKANCVTLASAPLIAQASAYVGQGIKMNSSIGTQSGGVAVCTLEWINFQSSPSAQMVICLWH